jgi:hypothetical protein
MANYNISRNHKDLEILCKATNTNPEDIGPSFRGGLNESYECNYMRVYGFRYWNKEDTERLYESVKLANEKTTDYNFVIVGLDDYEVEFDNDRSWPASFQFKSIQKENATIHQTNK